MSEVSDKISMPRWTIVKLNLRLKPIEPSLFSWLSLVRFKKISIQKIRFRYKNATKRAQPITPLSHIHTFNYTKAKRKKVEQKHEQPLFLATPWLKTSAFKLHSAETLEKVFFIIYLFWKHLKKLPYMKEHMVTAFKERQTIRVAPLEQGTKKKAWNIYPYTEIIQSKTKDACHSIPRLDSCYQKILWVNFTIFCIYW